MKTCCFFGHAQFSYEDFRDTIKSIVKDLIEHHGVTVFYSGGRGDFDSICARIVGELRRDYPEGLGGSGDYAFYTKTPEIHQSQTE